MEAENSLLARGRSVLWCTAPKVRDFWIPDDEEVQEKFRCKNDQKRSCVKVVTQDPFLRACLYICVFKMRMLRLENRM